MPRRSSMVAILLAVVIFIPPSFAADAPAGVWELRYAKKTVETPAKEATESHPPDSEQTVSGPKTSSSELVVRLEPQRLAIRESAVEAIYDFDRREILWVDHDARTVTHSSLFSDVAFRDAEFANRIMLSQVLSKAGVEHGPFDQTQLEVLFSMKKGDPGEPIEMKESGATLSFSVGGTEITTFTPDARALPEVLRQTLGRFLVYCCSLHPDVRRRIGERGHIPASLEYRYRDTPSIFDVDLQLRTARSSANAISVPSGFTPQADDRPLSVLLRRVSVSDEAKKSDDDYLQEAKSFRESGHAVDALLTLFEMVLATGVQPVDEIRQVATENREDEQLQTLLTAMRVAGEDPQKALDLNVSIDRDGLQKRHVLKIFQANYQTSLGNGDQAVGLFLDALKVNPYIAGVYKDLGDIYYRQYDMHTAWQCWDAARRVAPNHPMLGDIQNLEQHLQAAYPEFF
jgi:hypothetical protein